MGYLTGGALVAIAATTCMAFAPACLPVAGAASAVGAALGLIFKNKAEKDSPKKPEKKEEKLKSPQS